MNRLAYIIPSAILCTAVLFNLYSCKPEATPRAIQGEHWLTDFYKRYSIRGGWGFFGAHAKDSNVRVIVNVPAQQGKELGDLNRQDQIKFIATNACPPENKEIWGILDPEGDVIIEARIPGGVVFSTVPCRASREGLYQ